MDLNKLTEKSQEALQIAQSRAVTHGHVEIDGEHLLSALIDQNEGLLPRILQRMEIPVDSLRKKVDQELDKRPKVAGSTGVAPNISRRLSQILTRASEEAERMKDEYISVEHLALALIDEGNKSPAGRILTESGVTRDKFLQALTSVRGNQRVTSATPEATYEALAKFGGDLVEWSPAAPLVQASGGARRIRLDP